MLRRWRVERAANKKPELPEPVVTNALVAADVPVVTLFDEGERPRDMPQYEAVPEAMPIQLSVGCTTAGLGS